MGQFRVGTRDWVQSAVLLCLLGHSLAWGAPPVAGKNPVPAAKPSPRPSGAPAAAPARKVPAPAPSAAPVSAPNLPEVRSSWTENGKETKGAHWREQSAWIWDFATAEAPVKSPILRTWVEIPKEFRLQNIKGVAIRPIPNPDDSPFKAASGAKIVAVDTEFPNVTAAFSFKNAKGLLRQFELTIRMDFSLPYTLVKYSCAENGIGLLKRSGLSRFVYLVATCEDNGDAVDFYLLLSSDATLKASTLPESEGEGVGWVKYTLKKPKEPPARGYSLGTLSVSTVDGRSTEDFEILALPIKTIPRFYVTANLGFSYLSYQEQPHDIRLTEVGMVGKVNAVYSLVPRMLDIGMNAFMTLLPLNHSPTTLDAARFYGINGRVGYRLPIGLGAIDWSFLVGGYLWGMIVPHSAYGVKQLGGPQLFITMRNQQARHRSYFGYVKFAPISDNLSAIRFSDREVAAGGGYQLTSPQTSRDWTLTLDVADARFTSAREGNSMRLLSVSLGLQTGL